MGDSIQPKCTSIPIESKEINTALKESLSGILSTYDPISLNEMDSVKLMNRIDTKFLISFNQLPHLLQKASEHYRIVTIDGERIAPYSSIYFDTEKVDMYTMHHNGKLNRYKIRMRSYLNSGTSFLEIKKKNNKGRTSKKRISILKERFDFSEMHKIEQNFVQEKSPYKSDSIIPQLQNFFERLTLVDKNLTERVTIDVGLVFRNISTEMVKSVDNLVIIEMKQDGAVKSEFRKYLNELNVLPGSMSKYCLGMVLVSPGIKSNRFRKKIRTINKITNRNYATN